MDRLEIWNLALFLRDRADAVAQIIDEPGDGPLTFEQEVLRDSLSQLHTMADALTEAVREGKPLDFAPGSFIDNHTGTDYIWPGDEGI